MSDQINSTEEICQLLSNPPDGITFATNSRCTFSNLRNNYTGGFLLHSPSADIQQHHISGLELNISFTSNTDDLFDKTLKKLQNYVENNEQLVLTFCDTIPMIKLTPKPEYQELINETEKKMDDYYETVEKYSEELFATKKKLEAIGCRFDRDENDARYTFGFKCNCSDDYKTQTSWYNTKPSYHRLNIKIKCHQNTEFYKLCMESNIIKAKYQQDSTLLQNLLL